VLCVSVCVRVGVCVDSFDESDSESGEMSDD
jgi:hypothetical protein